MPPTGHIGTLYFFKVTHELISEIVRVNTRHEIGLIGLIGLFTLTQNNVTQQSAALLKTYCTSETSILTSAPFIVLLTNRRQIRLFLC
jgi:hypothetical protein